MKKIYMTWEQFNLAVEYIVAQIKHSRLKFDGIYSIPRGGLAFGLVLSHQLKLPLLMYPTEKTLVVDDISDNGITLTNIKHKKTACLYTSQWTIAKPDWFFYTKYDEKSWIIFPWEEIK